MKKVGVLGGMGPEATILLQSRLLNKVDAKDDSDHLPLLIDMNPQVPSRLEWILEKKGKNPVNNPSSFLVLLRQSRKMLQVMREFGLK